MRSGKRRFGAMEWVDGGCVMRCMAVDRRVLPHQRVHVRDRHEDSGPLARERLGDRELVEVAGVVVVDGRPEPIAQVADVVGRTGRPADGRQLLQRGRREVRLQAALDHGLARDCGQGGSVGGLALENAPGLAAHRGRVGAGCFHKLSPHLQFRISGRSWPLPAMYCLCSISLSRMACLA